MMSVSVLEWNFGGAEKMLRQIRGLGTYRLHASDGDIGHLEQFYFDDRDWKIKYFVVDIGTWLHGKKVLMSPSAIVGVDASTRTIQAAFNKQQVKESEDVGRHKPEGLDQAHDYLLYLGLPYYLGESERLPGGARDFEKGHTSARWLRRGYDEHLRSSKLVSRYHVMAVDGEIGQIEDGIVDDQTWTIRYLVSTVRNWWATKKVLVPTERILWVSAAESNVYVSLRQNTIADAPGFNPEKPLTREVEIALSSYYGNSSSDLRHRRKHRHSSADAEHLSSVVSLLETLDRRNYGRHKHKK